MMLFIFLSKFIIYVYYFFFVYVKKNVFFDECFIFGDFIIKKIVDYLYKVFFLV